MRFYDWETFAIAVFFLLAAVASSAPIYQRYLVGAIARRAGIGIPASLARKLRRRAASANRWGCIGGFVGFVGVYGIYRLEHIGPNLFLMWLCIAAGTLGVSLGSAISSLVSQLRVADESALRIARSRVVTISDYVPSLLHIAAWAIWALGVTVIVVRAAFGDNDVVSLTIIGLAGIGLILFEIAGRAIVAQGQPATSTDELVWDDALRSSTMRDLLSAPLLPAVFASLATIPATTAHGGAIAVSVVGVTLIIIGYIAYGLGSRESRGWYIERLWPHARRRTPEERAERDAAYQTKTVDAASTSTTERSFS